MKHKGCFSDTTRQKIDDLLTEYHKIISCSEYVTWEEIIRRLMHAPAPRFYVSEERAAIVLAAIHNGDNLKGMLSNKRRMFMALYRRAKKYIKEDGSVNWDEVSRIVVNQPAPSFYITPGSIKVTISREKRKWFEQKKKKLRHLF